MSTANLLITKDAVYLVCDGGSHNLATGEFLSRSKKSVELPESNSAFNVLGGAWVSPCLEIAVRDKAYESFSALVVGVAKSLPETIAEVHRQLPYAPRNWGQFVIVFAGWQDGPRATVMLVDDSFDSAPIIQRVEVLDEWYALPTIRRLVASDIEGSAIRLLEAQRAQRVPIVGSDVCASPATGHVELVTISANGIASKILHTWPEDESRN